MSWRGGSSRGVQPARGCARDRSINANSHSAVPSISQAAEELARGQQQGWAASSQVYEAMVTAVCEAGHLAEATEIVNRMKVAFTTVTVAFRVPMF